MSIQDVVKALCEAGKLSRFQPEYGAGAVTPSERGGGDDRVLYVSSEISELLLSEDPRWWDVATDFVLFVEATTTITVRRPGYDRDTWPPAAMVRLEPRSQDEPEEIWEVRPMMAEPPLRLFGSFIGHNEFVAITWSDRVGLDFGEAMRDCAAAWVEHFGNETPRKGRFPDAYLSNTRLVP